STNPWARFRFLVVGPLLAAPPAPGELHQELARLAQTERIHPITGQPIRFGFSTIERWYYQALETEDPIAALLRRRREDGGSFRSISLQLGEAIHSQYREHPSWSVALHRDNLKIVVQKDPSLGPLPSYSTVRRYMARHGLKKLRRRKARREGEATAAAHYESREVRSFEVEHVLALWHLDFHHGSRKILTPSGEWIRPKLLAVLDDRSRLICHAQWFLDETTQSLVHGLIQAILKRGLPRGQMTDNGSAMTAAETTEGLARLGILHETTLPYSPHQNGKQEVFWSQIEGRLLPMLEGEADLSLALLNRATQAWVEREYQRSMHSETGQTPLERWLAGPSVGRAAPSLEDLRFAFTTQQTRSQRRSDGTISLLGQRFEVPDRFRHLRRLKIRFASWDLRQVWIVDDHTDAVLDRCQPLDRARNADRFRRLRHAPEAATPEQTPSTGIAPLLRHLMEEYAATGLPPAYIPTEKP
ncbi:MAG TPA: DDE-type integrase/transposase/recombinase, partial [Thermoanaerobaculia bacterium]|nr:DDE-type integrase/transposase/recombinase [Thermoanaerobaculia bacterium]